MELSSLDEQRAATILTEEQCAHPLFDVEIPRDQVSHVRVFFVEHLFGSAHGRQVWHGLDHVLGDFVADQDRRWLVQECDGKVQRIEVRRKDQGSLAWQLTRLWVERIIATGSRQDLMAPEGDASVVEGGEDWILDYGSKWDHLTESVIILRESQLAWSDALVGRSLLMQDMGGKTYTCSRDVQTSSTA